MAAFCNRLIDGVRCQDERNSRNGAEGRQRLNDRPPEEMDAPLVGKGEADILVAFEQMEAVRHSSILKKDGIIVVNDYKIMPLPVASGAAEYPDNYIEALSKAFRVIAFNAGEAAMALGNARVMNIIMLGAMVEAFEMEQFDWDSALAKQVPQKFLDINRRAFEAGRA